MIEIPLVTNTITTLIIEYLDIFITGSVVGWVLRLRELGLRESAILGRIL